MTDVMDAAIAKSDASQEQDAQDQVDGNSEVENVPTAEKEEQPNNNDATDVGNDEANDTVQEEVDDKTEASKDTREHYKRYRNRRSKSSRPRRYEEEDDDTYYTNSSERSFKSEGEGVLTKAMDRVIDFLSPMEEDDESYTVFSADTNQRDERKQNGPTMKTKVLQQLDKHVLTRFGCSTDPAYQPNDEEEVMPGKEEEKKEDDGEKVDMYSPSQLAEEPSEQKKTEDPGWLASVIGKFSTPEAKDDKKVEKVDDSKSVVSANSYVVVDGRWLKEVDATDPTDPVAPLPIDEDEDEDAPEVKAVESIERTEVIPEEKSEPVHESVISPLKETVALVDTSIEEEGETEDPEDQQISEGKKEKKKKGFMGKIFKGKKSKKKEEKQLLVKNTEASDAAKMKLSSLANSPSEVSPEYSDALISEVKAELEGERNNEIRDPMDPERSVKAKREAFRSKSKAPAATTPVKKTRSTDSDAFDVIMSKQACDEDWGETSHSNPVTPTKVTVNDGTNNSSPSHVANFPVA